ncbi:hypothetical protein H6F76_00740 [Leptolyngbya sp. FACHB-321]|uniref:hypothetical protein n=1 Tax=Leptolyngbya sp. FACHB-321 TaxID=2692807 RepID=UPI001689FA8A|nr:hypothetical protein [Leptolyngbya sp. FACHB-321]MBD2033592.1 hypothetical protein [Leptolyngbya sp. FACHB-321]
MAQHSNWKTSGQKQQKGQSNASARARHKRKQLKRLSQKLRAAQADNSGTVPKLPTIQSSRIRTSPYSPHGE